MQAAATTSLVEFLNFPLEIALLGGRSHAVNAFYAQFCAEGLLVGLCGPRLQGLIKGLISSPTSWPAKSHLPNELSKSDDLQEARRQELTAYLQHLKHKQSAEPSADLTFGEDFYSLVQRLSEHRRTEYESIRGWVPIPNRLPSSTPLTNASDDPRIQEGLRQILQLDERLMQKSVEAAMVARETFPDTWSAADKKQAERDQKLLLASLERERARQARANRLAHAVHQLDDEGDKENSASLAQQQRPLYSLLEPAEAALVEKLLLQDDADAWGSNPFDCEAMPAETGSDNVQAAKLALLDDRIQAYQRERMWSSDSSQPDQR
ncbi:hypothetical protein ABBQ38_005025 [Trebouxia sp. C0009 RCD-2024]